MTIPALAPAAERQVFGELVDSTDLLADPEALRARAASDGYLFFRGYLPVEDLLPVREDLLSVVRRHGWLRPGQDSLGGLLDTEALDRVPAEQMRLDIGVSASAYCDAQRLETMHALPHHPRLVALYRAIFDAEVLVHPRHIVRMMTPHDAMDPIPTHQDFPLIQGTDRTWTCWAPLGVYPRELGGLAVLRASHHNGYLPIMPAAGAGGIEAQLCEGETDWWSTDYDLGDVLTFSSYTVHKGTHCTDRDQIRLSIDCRYQPEGEIIEEKSLAPHCELTWEQVYDGWQSTALQYYWRDQVPEDTLSPWNPDLFKPGRRVC